MKRIHYLFLLLVVLLLFGWNAGGENAGIRKDREASVPSSIPVPSVLSLVDSRTATNTGTFVTVARVIDGDTIEAENGVKIRYIGIDTPETHDPRRGVQCFGKEAYEKNKALIQGKRVRLEKDVSETDKYKRLLRYVYLDGLFVNEYLVREGYAKASSYPPDVTFQNQLRAAEAEARKEGKGMWGTACRILSPTPKTTP